MYFQIAQERSGASSVTKVCLTLFLQCFWAQLLNDAWSKYNAFFFSQYCLKRAKWSKDKINHSWLAFTFISVDVFVFSTQFLHLLQSLLKSHANLNRYYKGWMFQRKKEGQKIFLEQTAKTLHTLAWPPAVWLKKRWCCSTPKERIRDTIIARNTYKLDGRSYPTNLLFWKAFWYFHKTRVLKWMRFSSVKNLYSRTGFFWLNVFHCLVNEKMGILNAVKPGFQSHVWSASLGFWVSSV